MPTQNFIQCSMNNNCSWHHWSKSCPFTHIKHCTGAVDERASRTKSQSSLLNIYFLLSGFQSSLLYHSLLLGSKYLLMLHQSVTQNPSNKWSSTFEFSAVQLCSIFTEIMAKSLLSCVNRSNTRYSFRAGARTIRYSWFATTFLDHQHGRRDVTSKPEIVWT